MSERDDAFRELYRDARLDNQTGYYRDARSEYEAATRQGAIAAAGFAALSFVAGLLAVLDALGFRDGWGVVGAGVGALSGAAAGYAGLYAFERLAKLYADAERGLEQIPASLDATAVVAAEAVMQREQGQWGQLTADLPLAAPPAGS
jgi:SMODS and SLOG-associating 2TM effector domain 1